MLHPASPMPYPIFSLTESLPLSIETSPHQMMAVIIRLRAFICVAGSRR
ncbi:hypothetical protein SeGA_0243 [Salmonella enterica subsp. enterica serovar Gaminara str. A4-567]|nr:hypothetical protein SeGA_0243 [Salmonella enterica subsp. enterica serovar Gaminara str. A4-567]EHC54866.1 hypothetical protein LTSEGIV_0265 [Salmonella enterica subsp. enterica serovar Give str. S5-487]EHC56414.1 hypothetical protein LTSEHVI_0489 [Salmonella enterica subsp. enterica serovar Hvittingfoss str. A4-620]